MAIVTLLSFALLALSCSAHAHRRISPAHVVTLPYGSYQGFSSANGTESFLGIPFAQPPVGQLRFRHPLPPLPHLGVKNATAFGAACPKQNYTLPAIQGVSYAPLSGVLSTGASSEDCLFINVVKPANVTGKIPVVVWIYGGGFVTGDSSAYNATTLVARSVQLGEPIIYVSMNYRLNALGFLGGKEMKKAGLGNLGLWDQRLALAWVKLNIGLFGGDADKVTLWGQSAGSASVVAHMVHNDGHQNLFRAAVLESGYANAMTPIDEGKHQFNFENLTAAVGCPSTGSSSIDCLRTVPFDTLITAINDTPSLFSVRGLNLTWSPSVDGLFFTDTTKRSLAAGKFSKIPVIAGNTDDEGTLFSLYAGLDVTTDDEFAAWVQYYYLDVNATALAQVTAAYPQDPTQGSPFGTGTLYQISPEYKRIAAFLGDYQLISPRRPFLQQVSKYSNAYSYVSKNAKVYPYLGSVHGVDISEWYAGSATSDYFGTDSLVYFTNFLNPNLPSGATPQVSTRLSSVTWPVYGSNPSAPPMLVWTDPQTYTLGNDTYRQDQMALLTQLAVDLNL